MPMDALADHTASLATRWLVNYTDSFCRSIVSAQGGHWVIRVSHQTFFRNIHLYAILLKDEHWGVRSAWMEDFINSSPIMSKMNNIFFCQRPYFTFLYWCTLYSLCFLRNVPYNAKSENPYICMSSRSFSNTVYNRSYPIFLKNKYFTESII